MEAFCALALGAEADLARAGITPFGWVVNQSLSPVATRDPVLSARREGERPYLDEVQGVTTRFAIVPWLVEAPRGAAELAAVTRGS